MDLTRYMILNNKGQDITAICNYNQQTGYYDVTYRNGKTYNYKRSSLKILSDPIIEPINNKIIYLKGKVCTNVDRLCLFTDETEKHWRVFFTSGKFFTCHGDEIRIAQSCTGEKVVQEKLQYLKELAQSNELVTEDGKQLLLNDTKGIISPYRTQVYTMQRTPLAQLAEIDTVHKFQGRDKDEILFSTVDDVVNEFSDDAHLLNVAISRAKKRFALIVSGNEQPEGSNIGQLISYIQYNNFEIVNSQIYSVFDYLYKQFTEARINFLEKHAKISDYDSENLMFHLLKDIVKDNPQLTLELACHTSLKMLIRNSDLLTEEENLFKNRSGSHIDFLFYNKISKKPVLAIEVDGFAYHQNGGEQQKRRDRLKDSILRKYNIPLLRLPTNGSQERLRIEKALKIR